MELTMRQNGEIIIENVKSRQQNIMNHQRHTIKRQSRIQWSLRLKPKKHRNTTTDGINPGLATLRKRAPQESSG